MAVQYWFERRMMATAQATHSVKLRRNPLCSATTESKIGMHAKKALRISDFVLGMTVWALAISSTERAPNGQGKPPAVGGSA